MAQPCRRRFIPSDAGDLFWAGQQAADGRRTGQREFCGIASPDTKTLKGGLPMNRVTNRVTTALSLAVAFAAGCGATHLLRPALAADNMTAQVISTGEMEGDAI